MSSRLNPIFSQHISDQVWYSSTYCTRVAIRSSRPANSGRILGHLEQEGYDEVGEFPFLVLLTHDTGKTLENIHRQAPLPRWQFHLIAAV